MPCFRSLTRRKYIPDIHGYKNTVFDFFFFLLQKNLSGYIISFYGKNFLLSKEYHGRMLVKCFPDFDVYSENLQLSRLDEGQWSCSCRRFHSTTACILEHKFVSKAKILTLLHHIMRHAVCTKRNYEQQIWMRATREFRSCLITLVDVLRNIGMWESVFEAFINAYLPAGILEYRQFFEELCT